MFRSPDQRPGTTIRDLSGAFAHRALDPPPSSSLAEERTPPLAPPPCGGARFSDAHAPGTAYTEPVQTAQNAAGLDPGTVDPTWPQPSGHPSGSDTPGPKTISAALVYGSILLVLVLLVAAIWGFGGFKQRTDLFRTTPPGTLFTTGPYEFRFTEATGQHKRNYDNTFYWEIVMLGEGRTTGTESISPNYMGGSGMFASKDDLSQEISMPDSVRMGESRGFDRHRFTPGLPLSPYAVVFRYKDTYRPGPTIRFVVFDLIYGKHYLASEEKGWHNATYARQFYLPVRVLPGK